MSGIPDVEFDLDDVDPTVIDTTAPASTADVPDDAELAEFEHAHPADPAIEGTEGLR